MKGGEWEKKESEKIERREKAREREREEEEEEEGGWTECKRGREKPK